MKNKEKLYNRLIYIITGIVFLLLGAMRRFHINTDIDFSFLPAFYSVINAMVSVILIYAVITIKKGNRKAHQKAMVTALTLSLIFLLSYVVYHFTTPETKYCGEGVKRIVYFILLISHIALAGLTFPFILFTFVKGYLGSYQKHKKMAKWVFPLWLYVAVTGPIIYLMLRPCM